MSHKNKVFQRYEAVICVVFVLFLANVIIYLLGTGISSDPILIKSNQSYDREQRYNYLNSSFDFVQRVIEQRTTLPIKCDNSTHNLLSINPVHHNWAPYLFRCHLNYMEKWKHKTIGEVFITKKLFYQHLFKGGGTTIQRGLKKLVKASTLIDLIQYDKLLIHHGRNVPVSCKEFFQFIDNSTLSFTFVRDPINKFLSAFYEACKRRHVHKIRKSWMTGIGLLRTWISQMLDASNYIRQHDIGNFHEHYQDIHAQPNMNFLWRAKPFNFIGNLDHLANDMIQILDPFILDDELRNNSDLLMKQYFVHERSRHSEYGHAQNAKYNIDRTQLSDDDIKNLCSIYWMDYICLPFELPKQCNITELILNHYNKHVHYEECY